jgi:hypothetical protein
MFHASPLAVLLQAGLPLQAPFICGPLCRGQLCVISARHGPALEPYACLGAYGCARSRTIISPDPVQHGVSMLDGFGDLQTSNQGCEF